MRDYEAVYIFDPSLAEDKIEEKLSRYHDLVAGKNGGEVTALEQWGKRTLAYPIQDHGSGYYVVAQFSTEPTALPEYERILKLDDDLLRHLVVVNEGDLSPTQFEPPAEDSDDDDDSDEDEE